MGQRLWLMQLDGIYIFDPGLEKSLKSRLPFEIGSRCCSTGALPSGQVSKKSCLPVWEIYLPRMTGVIHEMSSTCTG